MCNHDKYKLLDKLAFHIGESCGIDPDDIFNKIMEFCGRKPESNIKSPYVKKTIRIFPELKSPTTGTNVCKFPLLKGKNNGKTCGTSIRGTGEYCSKHRNKKIPEE